MNKILAFLCSLLLLARCGGTGGNTQNPPANKPTVTATATAPVQNNDGTYSSTITWATTNATEVSISGYPTVSASSGTGTQVVTFATPSASFAVTAAGPGGTASYFLTIGNVPGPPSPKPPAPASVNATVTGSGEVTVNWSPVINVVDNTSSGISYGLFVDGLLTKNVTSPFVVIGLTNGVQYKFEIVAIYTTIGGAEISSDLSYPVYATPVNVMYDVLVTCDWTLPTTYTDGTPIALGDISRIVTVIYSNTTGVLPWGDPVATSLPGETTMTFTLNVLEGSPVYFTAVAVLDGQISDFAIPVSHVWGPPTTP